MAAAVVTCRYGPSPSGNLHVGSARTALFIYLFAKSQGGKFILRIDDTDQVRSNYDYTQEAIESLRWLGLSWDEGPVYQSKRFDRYREIIAQLERDGHAYREETEKGSAVRFRMPRQVMAFDDLVHGPVSENMALADDFVIQRSDGTPTYQVATVVDDHDMGITHLPRGNDLFRSTHRQNAIYAALGWTPPRYAHIPLVVGPDGGKLSKRHGATSVLDYRANGYQPAALLNYLATLGWAPKNRREIMSLAEMEQWFDWRAIGKQSVVFNMEKLNWYNRQYLKDADRGTLTAQLVELLRARGVLPEGYDPARLRAIVELLTPRYWSNADEFAHNAAYFFAAPAYDPAAGGLPAAVTVQTVTAAVAGVPAFTRDAIEQALRSAATEAMAFRDLAAAARLAMTGRTVSPDFAAIMAILGREETLRRLAALQEVCA